MKRSLFRRFPKRNLKTKLHGNTFMSLEQAIKHYMSDGVVNLPQAPEGAFEYSDPPGPDGLRGAVDASFDRFDAAASLQNKSSQESEVVFASNDGSSGAGAGGAGEGAPSDA